MAEEIELTTDNPYANGSIIEYDDGTLSLEREIKVYPKQPGDKYEWTKEGDTLTNLAGKYYNNSKYWHVLADANEELQDLIFDLPPGIYYRIPSIEL